MHFHFISLSFRGGPGLYPCPFLCLQSLLAPSVADASQRTITSLEAARVMQFTCMVTWSTVACSVRFCCLEMPLDTVGHTSTCSSIASSSPWLRFCCQTVIFWSELLLEPLFEPILLLNLQGAERANSRESSFREQT